MKNNSEKVRQSTEASTMVENTQSIVTRYPLFVVCVVLAILLVIMSVLYVTKDQAGPVVEVPDDLATLSDEEQVRVTDEVLAALSEVMILPDESTPIVASVTDSATLRGQQAFYAKAEDGDILVIFQSSRQAVIYRPDERKIVNTGPLIIDENVQ